jgi:Secretion system C-terminal sorting domain
MKMKKNNIKKSLLYCFLLVTNFVFAQKITSQVIDVSGGTQKNANNTLTYSIGQNATEMFSKTGNFITQGFQQPENKSTTAAKELIELDFSAKFFPNPTQGLLSLNIQAEDTQVFDLQVFDIQGRLVERQKIQALDTILDFTNLPKGTYQCMLVSQKSNKVLVSKIVKL